MSQDPNLPLIEQQHRISRSSKRVDDGYQPTTPTVVPIIHHQQGGNSPPPPSGAAMPPPNDGVDGGVVGVSGSQQQLSELSGALEMVHAQMENFNKRISKLEEKLTLYSKKSTKPATPAEKKKRNDIRKFFKDKTTREEGLLPEINRLGSDRETPDEQNDPLWKVVKEYQDQNQAQDTDPIYVYDVLRNYIRHKKKPRKNRLEERRRQRKQRKRNKRSKAFSRIREQMDKPIYAEISKYQGFCFDSVLMSSEESEDESTFRVIRLPWRSPALREVYQELDAIARREMPQSSNLQGEKRRVEASDPEERKIPTKVLRWPAGVQSLVLDPNYRPSAAELKAAAEATEVDPNDDDQEQLLDEEESHKRHKKGME